MNILMVLLAASLAVAVDWDGSRPGEAQPPALEPAPPLPQQDWDEESRRRHERFKELMARIAAGETVPWQEAAWARGEVEKGLDNLPGDEKEFQAWFKRKIEQSRRAGNFPTMPIELYELDARGVIIALREKHREWLAKLDAARTTPEADCALPPEPIEPSEDYRRWWDEAQECAGRTRPFAELRFWSYPDNNRTCPCPLGATGCYRDGLGSALGHVYVIRARVSDQRQIKHEMLHALGERQHPSPPFEVCDAPGG